jgi:2-polyprenyl-3-methyl-5-hydroxy-6-metoxy-1,4-benzoquinol methylase
VSMHTHTHTHAHSHAHGAAGAGLIADLDFTGERIVPGKTPTYLIWAHTARYQWIRDAVRDKAVLDAGCGEGYGSYFLSHLARSVAAVDISQEDVDHARSVYARPNLAYQVMDCTDLQFADESFDVVSSFEVIEHVKPVDAYLKGIRRVLKPGGRYYVSTPNGGNNLCAGMNPFHEKEFTAAEFREMLTAVFPNVEFFGQFCARPWRESLFMRSTKLYLRSPLYRGICQRLAPLYFRGSRADGQSASADWVDRVNPGTFVFRKESIERAPYFVAVCTK